MIEENTPQNWDKLWDKGLPGLELILKRAECSSGWQCAEKVILENFKTFDNLEVVELGSGVGKIAILMAKRGAKVTCVDFSDRALKEGRRLFAAINLSANFVKADVLNLPAEMLNRFSVSMSWGLAEHFSGEDRARAINSHAQVLKKGGIFLVSVPNKYCLAYRMYKFIAEILHKWEIPAEYPFSRKELKDICARIGINDYILAGSSFTASFRDLNPLHSLAKAFKLKEKNPDPDKLTKDQPTFLDQYLGSALILIGKK